MSENCKASDVPRGRQRLWVVSELYYPEETSTGYFLTRIAEALASDFEVHAIAGQPHYSERGIVAPRSERRNGVQIHRLRSTHFDKDRLVLRAVNLVTFTIAALFFGLIRFSRNDRILVVTNPPTMPLAIGLASKVRGARSVLLVHDVYPEILSALGLLDSGSILYRVLERVFARAYRLHDRIIVLGRDMKEVIARKFGGVQGISIIPNWADADEISPIDPGSNQFRHEHGLRDQFVVQFSGNIGRSHDIELVLGAAHKLRHHDHITFLFVGYGGKSDLVIDAERRGLSNVKFVPRQPREKLAQMLSSSDVTIISFVDGMYGLSVPSRMYNVMASGTPILASAHPKSELSLVVEEEGAGWVLPSSDADTLASEIERLAGPARAECRARGANGRKAAEGNYALSAIARMYRDLFAQV